MSNFWQISARPLCICWEPWNCVWVLYTVYLLRVLVHTDVIRAILVGTLLSPTLTKLWLTFTRVPECSRVSRSVSGCVRTCQDVPGCVRDPQDLTQGNLGIPWPNWPETVTRHSRAQVEGWRLFLLPRRLLERPLSLVSLRGSEMDIFPLKCVGLKKYWKITIWTILEHFVHLF